MPKPSARRATQLLKLGPYKTTAIQALQPHDSATMVRFFNWCLQSVDKVEIDHQLTFIYNKS
jgi:hypothetical protein